MNEQITITGYHGTKKENVESICKNNFYINEDEKNNLYLGAGIYFFYLCDDAIDWNIKKFKKAIGSIPTYKKLFEKYSIIESNINVEERDILDLDNKDTLYKLELLIGKVKGKLITKQEYLRARNKTSAIINMMYVRKMIKNKVLVKTFFEPIHINNLESFKNYPRKMFCVKDTNIIYKSAEKVDIDESVFDSVIYFYR